MSPPAYMLMENTEGPSYFLSEVRLCASDPVQDFTKGESLCNPCQWSPMADTCIHHSLLEMTPHKFYIF